MDAGICETWAVVMQWMVIQRGGQVFNTKAEFGMLS